MACYLNKIASMFLNPNNPNKKPPPSSFTDVFDLFLNELIIDWIDIP